jgi:hypothetical protein
MSDGLSISGGVDGVGARLQDLRAQAGLLDDAGDDVRGWTDDVAKIALDPDITVAALLCPVEVAGVAATVAGATVGRHGLLVVSTGLEATAIVLRASATTYEFVDAASQAMLERLQNAAGFVLGATLPFLALGGGAALLGGGMVLAGNPSRWPALVLAARNLDPAALQAATMQGLYENPWLLDRLTRMAPGMLQGTTWSLGTLLGGPAGGFAVPYVLSGGQWPTQSYEDAVAGLVNAGGRFGMLGDTGEVGVTKSGDEDPDHAPRSIAEIFREQNDLGTDLGTVQIVRVTGSDGSASWIVQIPGTQEWHPTRGDNPVDLTTNLRLMAGEATFMQKQVAEAMRQAGVLAGDPVMLTGHSQGGITAASLAADSTFRDQFSVRSVVTGGSPIARFDIPSTVSVLSLEHVQDAVPMLEGRENPARANWVSVERTLPEKAHQVADTSDMYDEPVPAREFQKYGPEGSPPRRVTIGPGVGAAHGTDVYADTGALVDASEDVSVQRWLDGQSRFFSGDADVTRWDVTR